MLIQYFLAVLLIALAQPIRAETSAAAWLRYAPLNPKVAQKYSRLPSKVVALGDSPVLQTAQRELVRDAQKLLSRNLIGKESVSEPSIILGTLFALHAKAPTLRPSEELRPDAYWLKTGKIHGHDSLLIVGANDRGVLYGVFALLSKIAREESISPLDEVHQPSAPIRWVNQWDNLDGRIERGYGGPSIFFADGKVRPDLSRAAEYARLLASIGINGCTVNNVNAAPTMLDENSIPQLARIAEAFRPWGVQLSISVDFSSPKTAKDLDTFDPLDPKVAEWWRKKVDDLYRKIPDLGGFVMKADSEGRLGPSTYGRSHADAANVIARALKLHHGLLFYRAFVYNHHLDWRDLKNDRAKAAYDNFHALDGAFDDNVVIQIKNGPIDFQVREPVSPLFAGLGNTNEAIELQITQEYMGQQRHLCFLAPMWKEVLDFDMRVDGGNTPVKDIVSGRTFHRPAAGFIGVTNVGMDDNWLGSPLALANLFAFGRLAWDPNLSSENIIDEWTHLTFGSDPVVVNTISTMQLNSWHTYENYTGNLGVGTLTNITGNHYDPAPESSERNGWGQWHRANHDGIGMDRTIATGTGYIGQYPPDVQKLYEPLAKCPDELLLFFHHVPYTYKLHSGKTAVQHFYDSHYEGAAAARELIQEWKTLQGHVDDERYRDILARLEYQAGQAIVWRDTINNWIFQLSGIADGKHRFGETL
jgi:alpha-glucuronidase